MEAEFYIVNLVRTNQQARALVCQSLGYPLLTPEEAMGALVQLETFSTDMRWAPRKAQYFTDMQRRLDEAQGVLHTPPVVTPPTEEDLRRLLSNEGRETVAELLQCSPTEYLQRIFSSADLAELLVGAGIINRREAQGKDSEWLLFKMMPPRAALRLARHRGRSDRWDILQRLVRDQARRELAQSLNCREEEVLRFLAAHIRAPQNVRSSSHSKLPFSEGEAFDFIGLSTLRVQMQAIRHSLLEEAKSQADNAKALLPGHTLAAVLPAMIRFHHCREFKAALGDLISTTQPLRQLGFNNEEVEHVPITKAPGDSSLEVTAEPEAGPTADEKDLVIKYRAPTVGYPVEVLRLRAIGREEWDHIQQHLPGTVGELPPVGPTLSDRVLNTRLPLFSSWRRKLREAISDPHVPQAVDNAFVQAFVLSGASINQDSLIPELDDINRPGIDTTSGAQVEFPKSTSDIAASLKEKYNRDGKPPKLIAYPR